MNLRGSLIDFDIYPASWRDLGALRRIEKACFPIDAWPLFDMIAVLTFNNVVRLKAVVKEQVVGFVAGEQRGRENIGWIATIGVLPDYQRKGIATALMRECESRLEVTRIRLSVRAGNLAAIQLYKERGYRQIGQWSRYYQDGSDALVYEKKVRLPL
jgi:ribosomal-protein-alanine N-acetyltransferase